MNKISIFILITGVLTLSSCSFFDNQNEENKPVARIHNEYLTQEDLQKVTPANINREDSVVFVRNYINRWATKQLLLKNAEINLSKNQQDEFDAMTKEYQQELYTESYKDMVMNEQLDTVISDDEMETYFEDHKENFKLREDLLQVRYIKIDRDYPELDEIKKKFKRYNTADKEDLLNQSIKFDMYSFNDSVWVRSTSITNRIPELKEEKEKDFLEKENTIHLKDSLSFYMIYIKDVRLHNEQAPLSYIKPTLKQIILNKRKLKFAREFEKDITKDAIEENEFEIYE